MKLIPTILCGGAGSRLWPVSRELHPKPFIRLADGQSLLQKAWLRGAGLPDVAEVLTVTNRELFFKTEDEYREVAAMGHKDLANSFILEPFGRNTAPAIAAAALQVAATHGEDAVLLVLAADHLIADQAAFAAAVAQAVQLAQQGKVVTFGIQPDAPETGYGYIEADGNTVLAFVEKPSLEKAQAYLATGRYLWNAGIFCFAAGTMLREMAQHCPAILAATRACIEQASTATGKGFTQIELTPNAFAQVPDNSIDYAVMEKSLNMAVVPCSIGWSDIGSWSAVGDLTTPDCNGNRVEGEVQLHDVNNCYIQSNERMVGNLDVEREFNDVRFVCAAYLQLLAKAKPGEVVNICTGKPVTLKAVLALLSQITGHQLQVKVNPAFVRANEIHRLCGNPAKLVSVVGELKSPALEDTLRWMLDAAVVSDD